METASGAAGKRNVVLRRAHLALRRIARLDATVHALLWSVLSGLLFVFLNSLLRELSRKLPPFEVQCLRYVLGLAVMLPLVLSEGLAAYRPQNIAGQFTRGAVHTAALCIWFTAVTHISIADTTAIGFTSPIFVMLGAAWFFREPMRWARWVASLAGLAGVLIVVAPKLTGQGGGYLLVMLASAPVFAASFLLTKVLTRNERAEVIVVWQSIAVALLSLPLALMGWQWPTAGQWGLFVVAGILGSAAHYCLTRSFARAEISATQSVKFLDLVWATLLGWLWFGDAPSGATIIGGVVICTATLWIARREARGPTA
jgi:drug/metabolite transporter (DMT)-like permease